MLFSYYDIQNNECHGAKCILTGDRYLRDDILATIPQLRQLEQSQTRNITLISVTKLVFDLIPINLGSLIST